MLLELSTVKRRAPPPVISLGAAPLEMWGRRLSLPELIPPLHAPLELQAVWDGTIRYVINLPVIESLYRDVDYQPHRTFTYAFEDTDFYVLLFGSTR